MNFISGKLRAETPKGFFLTEYRKKILYGFTCLSQNGTYFSVNRDLTPTKPNVASFFFQLRHSDQEMTELRTNNQVLSERLESLSRSSFTSYSQTSSSVQMSLLNEMEMSTSGSDSDRSLYLRRYYNFRL